VKNAFLSVKKDIQGEGNTADKVMVSVSLILKKMRFLEKDWLEVSFF